MLNVVAVVVFVLCTALSQQHQPISDNREPTDDIGYFWQVTDFHFDENYTHAGDPNLMCHASPSTIHYDLGKFGDYRCDSPLALVKSAINAMKRIDSQPDFVLWTGDAVPHVPNSIYNKTKVVNTISNITDALMEAFNTTEIPIIPSFGNHDAYPAHQMSPYDAAYYDAILKTAHWDQMVAEDQRNNFKKGGYYSIDISDKLTILSLNTALYYHSDNITRLYGDPSDQFQYLTDQLKRARLTGRKIYIAAHVPPGSFELSADFKWFHDNQNVLYLAVLLEYIDVIHGQFYGHEHTDSIRLYTRGERAPESDGRVMFLSPAVTPWKSTIPGVGSNNPSIRLYQYNRTSLKVLDYHQYMLNLTQANQDNVANWTLEYKYTEAYNVKSVTFKDVKTALSQVFNNTVKDNIYWKRYLQYNSVSAQTDVKCAERCRRMHYCAVYKLDYTDYDLCLRQWKWWHRTTHHPPRHHMSRGMSYVVIALAISVFLLAIAVLILCIRQNHSIRTRFGFSRLPSYGATQNEYESKFSSA